MLKARVKEKKITWTQSNRESATCTICLKKQLSDEKREERERDKLGDKQEAFLNKKEEEEDEATCLIEEMRKNVEAAQHKSYAGSSKVLSLSDHK